MSELFLTAYQLNSYVMEDFKPSWTLRERRAMIIDDAFPIKRCVNCGAGTDLQFDHINPASKEFEINANLSRRHLAFLPGELAKCQMLCKWCHGHKYSVWYDQGEFFILKDNGHSRNNRLSPDAEWVTWFVHDEGTNHKKKF